MSQQPSSWLVSLANLLAYVTRHLAFIPGFNFLTRPLHSFFTKRFSKYPEFGWRVILMPGGYKLKLNIAYRMAALVYWRGAHEWAPIYIVKKYFKKGANFYDVGANMGEFSVLASTITAGKGQVVSFEPMNEMFALLKENIQMNQLEGVCTVYNSALSDKNGSATLYAAHEDEATGAQEDGLHTLFGTNARCELLHEIALNRLDDLMEQDKLPAPDFMKIDVEGAELFVLKGAENTLRKYKPALLLEFNKETSEAAGYTQEDLLNFLQPLGYEFYDVLQRGRLEKLDRHNLPVLTNIYCIAK